MKKNIAIIVLLIAMGILLFFLLRGGKEYDSHTNDYDLVKADNKYLQAQRNAGLKKIDSLTDEVKRRDSSSTKLKVNLSINRKELDKSVAKIVRLSDEAAAYKAVLNEQSLTWIEVIKLDSIKEEATNLAYLYNQYKAHSDSLSLIVDSNRVDYEKALSEQRRLYEDLQLKYDQLYRLYDNLFKDYSSARKTVKLEKLKTKIAALLGLGVGAAGAAGVLK